jgi:hypothetical protein
LLTTTSQGVVSVILVMPQFLNRFGRVSDTASGAGFWKGLLTAMIELGALIGTYRCLHHLLLPFAGLCHERCVLVVNAKIAQRGL